MNADGGNFKLTAQGPAVEGLNILQFMAENQVAGVDFAVGQGIKHEGIVRIGAMAHGNQALAHQGFL
jgi:hypothetical protein